MEESTSTSFEDTQESDAVSAHATDEGRIDELEVKVAFQEETIRSLEAALTEQHRHLRHLEDEIEGLKTALRRAVHHDQQDPHEHHEA